MALGDWWMEKLPVALDATDIAWQVPHGCWQLWRSDALQMCLQQA